MRNAVKNRLIVAGFVLTALACVICSVAWAFITFEAALNFLWVLLAFSVLVHGAAPTNDRRCARLPRLVILVIALSLLFPVISANDDFAQLDLMDDGQNAQSIVSSLKTDKQLRAAAGLLGLPTELGANVSSFLLLTSEFVLDPVDAACVATAGNATGNHSPPLC